ncbi:unnamed protein product [Acanthosepion pharaonis]|uniref:Uncharacterized protein n=1 Tax=Acanthosepion pharaonis TaxID=158019 RepID=A0A812D3Z5_ACAPH|nr:unnamed protein product [Sepia pharaonis]
MQLTLLKNYYLYLMAPLTSFFATAFPLRRQLTPAASSTPTVSSSPQQLPAASSSPLRRSTDVPLPIPAPTDVQLPLMSGHRSRTNDLCRLTIHRSQIKTRFPSSTTDHLHLSSFFAIANSLPFLPKDELTTPALSASFLSLLKRRRALYSRTDIQGSTGPRTPLFHRPTSKLSP